VDHLHLLAEAWRRAFADRNRYLADPDFASIPANVLSSERYGASRAEEIDLSRASPSALMGPGPGPEGSHTTHFSIVDPAGNAAAVTTTLNTWYGSKLVVEGAGFLLNNEMDDFTAKSGAPNFFGLVQGAINAIEPGKRSLSAMTPTIVLDRGGRTKLVVGTPGGATIITTVFQVLSNMLDHGFDLERAVAAPRIHHQHLPDRLQVEPGGVPAEVVAALRDRGHEVSERPEWSGDVQAVIVDAGGRLLGVADPRRGGTAVGY
jgi:gamma-glutamyltranspeptidase/glutathione hydrolase